jgi:drug/metabolite transporter (DMT)-like permease
MSGSEVLRRNAGSIAGVALVVTWSSGFVGAELGSRAGAQPLTVLGWRFVLLTAGLVALAAIKRVPLNSWAAWRRQMLLGAFCQAGYLICVFEGVSHGVHGGTAALIAALQPLLVATVAGRLLGERSTPVMWVGMLLGLTGVVTVVSGDVGTVHAPAWAYLFPTIGMLSLASGTVLSRKIEPPDTLLQTITMQAAFTAVVTMVAAVASGDGAPPASPEAWGAVAWLVVLASLGGYVMYVLVNKTAGATAVSALLFLTPPTTMLWVYVMFGEPISTVGIVGLVVSAAGVVLTLRSRQRASTYSGTIARRSQNLAVASGSRST